MIPEIKPEQSIELLKELHILTRDGKLNQDSRRKLKQVYHLYHFIEPLLKSALENSSAISLVDHGAGKSYLGFIIYDLFFKKLKSESHVYGIETRSELIAKSQALAQKLQFEKMKFINASVADAKSLPELPSEVQIVTALHACDTATDDAIDFALVKKAKSIVLVPCCQAEVAACLREKKKSLMQDPLSELFRHPLHTREFGSHLTNVLRTLRLMSAGYDVTVTELVGFEHSMKNELIIAIQITNPDKKYQMGQSQKRLTEILQKFKLEQLTKRFEI